MSEPIRKILVCEFFLADVEDPEIYAAQPLYEWRNSNEGQWFMNHSVKTPEYNIVPNEETMGFRVQVFAHLSGPALVEWLLRSEHGRLR